jgi:hypothetical protein
MQQTTDTFEFSPLSEQLGDDIFASQEIEQEKKQPKNDDQAQQKFVKARRAMFFHDGFLLKTADVEEISAIQIVHNKFTFSLHNKPTKLGDKTFRCSNHTQNCMAVIKYQAPRSKQEYALFDEHNHAHKSTVARIEDLNAARKEEIIEFLHQTSYRRSEDIAN